jgi:hypothetical protein
LEDIDRVDPESFKMQQDIAKVLEINYAHGFSFLVCRFKTKLVEPHPIAYEHERLPDGQMFVPTRHAHGASVEGTPGKTTSDQVETRICKDLRRQSGLRKGLGLQKGRSFRSYPRGRPRLKGAKGGGVVFVGHGGHGATDGAEDHADWDHDIYTTCVQHAKLSNGAPSFNGAGMTPKEKLLQLQTSEQYGFIKSDVEPSTALSRSGLTGLVDLLPCGELLRHMHIDLAIGKLLPNEDFVLTVDPSFSAQLPAPACLEERKQHVIEELSIWKKRKCLEAQAAVIPAQAEHPLEPS